MMLPPPKSWDVPTLYPFKKGTGVGTMEIWRHQYSDTRMTVIDIYEGWPLGNKWWVQLVGTRIPNRWEVPR